MNQAQLISPGTVIRETYTVDRHIASGGFSDVYRVRHRYMGMQAMKVMRDGKREEQRASGLIEAFRLSRISHPSIVRVYDGNCLEKSLGGLPYVTMELIEGGTLEDLWTVSGKKFIPNLLDACDQLADALEHAHGQTPSIIHRDIKPSNVLIVRDADGTSTVRLADFGLAVPIDESLGFAAGHGTLVYRSPESLAGFETPASDVYSWGLTIYEAATGVFPFKAQLREANPASTAQLIEALRKIQSQPIDLPSYFRQAIHPVIDVIIMRTLAVATEMRIADGASLRTATRAMREAVEGDPTPSAHVARALRHCRDPANTPAALDLVERSLRADPAPCGAYARFLTFLRNERDRLAL